jgi:hypothetical protein
MLHEGVREIGVSGLPVSMELSLVNSILYPVKVHVHSFRLALLKLFVAKSIGRGIVDLNWGGWLGVSYFVKGNGVGQLHPWCCWIVYHILLLLQMT